MNDTIEEGFVLRTEEPKIIKVIGVGGGGGNAVTHMYRKGIHDVSFLLSNTDKQALKESDVPVKLVLGETITKGLGSGNIPETGKAAAEESVKDIQNMLGDGTRMVFITAGMGGGTGTGAAPVIAGVAKAMDILTVGIVTIPFKFEGKNKIIKALDGVDEISKNVDALLVINNERLREIYPDLTLMNGFEKADDTLAIAAKSIAEIITLTGKINLDFADVNTTLKDGGVALISNGYGSGSRRVSVAIEDALKSPLLNNNDIFTAKRILFNISFSKQYELLMEEMGDVHEFMSCFKSEFDVIWGTMIDDSLGDKVKITILASGFGVQDMLDTLPGREDKKKEEDERIGKVYGSPDNTVGKADIYILSIEEMDNDEIVSLMEDNPAYNRDPRVFRQYRDKGKNVHRGKPESNDGKGKSSTAISF